MINSRKLIFTSVRTILPTRLLFKHLKHRLQNFMLPTASLDVVTKRGKNYASAGNPGPIYPHALLTLHFQAFYNRKIYRYFPCRLCP